MTTAFVIGQAGTATPVIDGVAAVGTSKKYAREDHKHPTDTTRAPVDSPTFTTIASAPTAVADTSTTQIATTAFVIGQASSTTPAASTTAGAVGTSKKYARADHSHPALIEKYSVAIAGGATSEVITHNLNTREANVTVRRTASPYDMIMCGVEFTTVNTVTLKYGVSTPAAGEYTVTIIG